MRKQFEIFSILIVVNSILSLPLFAAPAGDNTVRIDGSSTVYPITEAVAEEYGIKNRSARITVGVSGTGGGFKKFCKGEVEISNASRPIKPGEVELCAKGGVEYLELPVAYDALSVVVNKRNTFVDTLTVAELKKIWEPAAQRKITNWNQIRSSFPDKPLNLFGPGVDSGTFDYFTEVIVGQSQASRGDFTSSEDDNVLVQGVSSDINALGFFGLAYYQENKKRLKAIAIDDGELSNGTEAQMPTIENVVAGKYVPLARPLFIYVRKDALKRPIVKDFITFYLQNSAELATEVGYVEVPIELAQSAKARLAKVLSGAENSKVG